MKSSNTANRLKQWLQENNAKQVDVLARAKPYIQEYGIPLSKADISQYVSGKVEPGQKKLFILSKALGVSEAWLMGYDSDEHPLTEALQKIASAVSPKRETELFAKYVTDFIFSQSEHFNVSDKDIVILSKYNQLDEHGAKVVDLVLDAEYERCCQPKVARTASPLRVIPFSNIPASAGSGEWLDAENMDEIEIPDIPEYRSADFAVPVAGNSMMPTYNDGDVLLVHEQDAVNVGDIGLFAVNGDGFVKEMGNGELISHNHDYDNVSIDESFRCFGKVIGKL